MTMTDYYNILGISRNATQDDIKKAYRKMASQHHPDKGGDTAQFQKIQEAYATLSDEQKKAQYDNPQAQFTSSHFNNAGFEDIFAGFGFGGGFGGFRQQHQVQRNKTINIRVEVSLKEVIQGKEVIGAIRLPSGQEQALQLKIPPGVSHGETIRFKNLGDNSIPGIPRGDLIAQIVEPQDPHFIRDGYNIVMPYQMSVFSAMLGKTIRILTPEDKQLEIVIPQGMQSGQMIKCKSHGIPVTNSSQRGDLYVKIDLTIPKNMSAEDLDIIKDLSQRYSA